MAANAKWIAKNQAELAEACGVSLATISHWARLGMPGKQGHYDLREVFRWSRTVGPCNHAKQKADPDDPLLDDTDSPGLERYRLAKAAIAELDLEERKGSLLSRDKARAVLGRWASVIRRMGESLVKAFGNGAAEIVNDALGECKSVVDYEFGGSDIADDGTEGGVWLGAITVESADRSDDEPMG